MDICACVRDLWKPQSVGTSGNKTLFKRYLICAALNGLHIYCCATYCSVIIVSMSFYLYGKNCRLLQLILTLRSRERFFMSFWNTENYSELLGGSKTTWYHTIWLPHCFLSDVAQYSAAVSNFLPPSPPSLTGRQPGKAAPGDFIVWRAHIGSVSRIRGCDDSEYVSIVCKRKNQTVVLMQSSSKSLWHILYEKNN